MTYMALRHMTTDVLFYPVIDTDSCFLGEVACCWVLGQIKLGPHHKMCDPGIDSIRPIIAKNFQIACLPVTTRPLIPSSSCLRVGPPSTLTTHGHLDALTGALKRNRGSGSQIGPMQPFSKHEVQDCSMSANDLILVCKIAPKVRGHALKILEAVLF